MINEVVVQEIHKYQNLDTIVNGNSACNDELKSKIGHTGNIFNETRKVFSAATLVFM